MIKINWTSFLEKMMTFIGILRRVFTFVFYFIITIVFISSFGVWIPFLIDHSELDKIQPKTFSDLPWSLVSYSIAIVAVSYIDRIDHLFKSSSRYRRNYFEFLILILLIIFSSFLVYKSLTDKKFGRIDDAVLYASILTIVSWGFWIYVKIRTPKHDSFATLGGSFD